MGSQDNLMWWGFAESSSVIYIPSPYVEILISVFVPMAFSRLLLLCDICFSTGLLQDIYYESLYYSLSSACSLSVLCE